MQIEQESETYWEAGNGLHNTKEYQKAAIAYSRAIRFDSNLHEVYANWANTLRLQKNFAGSKPKAVNAIRISPSNDWAHRIIGHIYEEQGQYVEAEVKYREAIQANALSNMSYFKLANLLDELERYDEAEIQYAEGSQLDPGDCDMIYMWAVTLYNQMKYGEAAAKFEEARVLNPFDADIYVSFGLILNHQGDPEGANTMYQKAVDLLRDEPERIGDVINLYEDEIMKSEKKLSGVINNEAKKAHFERDIDGMRIFVEALRNEKSILKEDQIHTEL